MKKGTFVILTGFRQRASDGSAVIAELNKKVGTIGRIMMPLRKGYKVSWYDRELNAFVSWCFEDEIRPLTKGERLLLELNGHKYLRKYSDEARGKSKRTNKA